MNITQIIAAIALAIGTIVGGAGSWLWQSSRVAAAKQELSNEQLDRANERIAQQRASRANLERLTNQVSKAQTDAAARAVRLAADRDGAKSELDRLRIASESAVRAAASGLDACTSAVRTYAVIQSQCAGALADMGADADWWTNQALTLQQAWPK